MNFTVMQQSTVKRAIKKHINLPNVEELFVSIANASLAGTLITMADGAILLLSYQLSPDLHSPLADKQFRHEVPQYNRQVF